MAARYLSANSRFLKDVAVVVLGVSALLPFVGLFFHRVRLFGRRWSFPSPKIMFAQYLVGVVDILATGAVLYLVLPDQHTVPFFPFITLFSVALWLGVISHLPGGLGVFEAVMVSGLIRFLPSSHVLGALILYRVIYYFIPFT